MFRSDKFRLDDEVTEKAGPERSCCRQLASFPRGAARAVAEWFTSCCRSRDGTEETGQDDRQTLISERPFQFPRQAASSFLRPSTPSRMDVEPRVVATPPLRLELCAKYETTRPPPTRQMTEKVREMQTTDCQQRPQPMTQC
ncbi:hypothetical protein DCS_04562 [Drechmeria coniospora]|uniref:Uncharacterized protein n=1 Tax=Drechmeria coniospora TaxID=98403 RepID=A0A151GKI7_DRECN|nr:hypothetical protein DCS_04562 [Drechmeria coniospora]KYK57551.1 hypothetical protein DCS_04562 [Drechmeria coniospora]ODA79440.1 hypothetical protein RJ55_05033 [Drechmeria coniospora]